MIKDEEKIKQSKNCIRFLYDYIFRKYNNDF